MRECQPPLPLTEDAKCERGGDIGRVRGVREDRGGEFGRVGSKTIGGRFDTWLPGDPHVLEKSLLLAP